jgi:2-isopropylmalate synthase
VEGPVIAGLARTHVADIDAAWNAVRDAARPRIHTFISTSDIHIEYQLQTTREDVEGQARAAVAHAKQYTDDVEFSPMDATRADVEFTANVCQIAIEEGATTINIPDTVGYTMPHEFTAYLERLYELTPGLREVVVSVHCHDDLGLAVANSFAGLLAGARQVECAINGLGERAGNAALEEIVMAIKTRGDFFGHLGVGVRTEELARTSRVVSRLTGYPVQYNKAVVGRNAFAHESGIHQHGVLEDRETYEIIDATAVGQEAAQIVLGKHSGRHAFADSLAKMGITIRGDALNAAFTRFKELADRKVQITEADLEAIVAEELGARFVHRYDIVSLDLHGGTSSTPTAKVVLSDGSGKREAEASGNGMIDAAIAAIASATGVVGELVDFQVSAVTGGGDALGDVVLQLQVDGHKVTGRGVSTDVVEASARAYLNAVNRVVRLRERGEVREIEIGP